MLNPQSVPFADDFQQAIDVGMLAGVLARVFGMFRIQLQPFVGGLNGDRSVELRQVIVDGQRTDLPRLVFNECDLIALRIQELDRGKMGYAG